MAADPPVFDAAFRDRFAELLAWRRDVRRFRRDAVPDDTLKRLLTLADLAPSVGNSQPWRWVRVDDPTRRTAIQESFARCNAAAAASYDDTARTAYLALKLEGLQVAPLQLAVFCDCGTEQGHGLGRRTMPETLLYSTVTSIHTFWLAARAEGIGVGWVSILEPDHIAAVIEVPADWRLVAYLCVGWPQEEHDDPELVRARWQQRAPLPLIER